MHSLYQKRMHGQSNVVKSAYPGNNNRSGVRVGGDIRSYLLSTTDGRWMCILNRFGGSLGRSVGLAALEVEVTPYGDDNGGSANGPPYGIIRLFVGGHLNVGEDGRGEGGQDEHE